MEVSFYTSGMKWFKNVFTSLDVATDFKDCLALFR